MNIVDKINWSKNCKKCLRPLLEYREIIGMSLRNWGSHSWRNPQFAIAVYRDICKWEAQHLEIWPLFALKIVLNTIENLWCLIIFFSFYFSNRVESSVQSWYLRYFWLISISLSDIYQKCIRNLSAIHQKLTVKKSLYILNFLLISNAGLHFTQSTTAMCMV